MKTTSMIFVLVYEPIPEHSTLLAAFDTEEAAIKAIPSVSTLSNVPLKQINVKTVEYTYEYKEPEVQTVTVEVPVEVEKLVEIEKIVYVDREVPVPSIMSEVETSSRDNIIDVDKSIPRKTKR